MTTINNLTTTEITGSDLIALWSSGNSDSRKASISALLAYIQANTALAGQVSQYSAPSAESTVVEVENEGVNTRLILTPVAAYTDMTIALDPFPADQETLSISTTNPVTTLTLTGGTVSGAPGFLASSLLLQYDLITNTWYRVQA